MRLLIIEDEQQLASSMKEYLRKEGYQSDLAPNVDEALEKISFNNYDCILLDITLPDGNGLQVLGHLKQTNKTDGIIIISARDSLDDRIKGLSLGADDYLPKPFHLSELSARIGAIIRRKNFNGSTIISFKEISIDVAAQIVKANDSLLALTRKEYDLLLYLISNKNRVISKNAIASHLSGDLADMIDDYGFVYAHIKNLKKKLHDARCGDYIKTVYGFGYQWTL